jgi:glycosyltransferase involved in cell wall biosynthesis
MQTFLRLENLKKRGNSVFLMTLGLPGDAGHILSLKKIIDDVECVYARPDLSKARHLFRKSVLYEIFTYDRRFAEILRLFAQTKAIDVAVFEGLGVAQYRGAVPHIPAVLYEHNVEHEITGQLVSYLRKSPLKVFGGGADETLRNFYLYLFGGKEKELVRALEVDSLTRFDLVMTCSRRDADMLNKDAEGASLLTVPWLTAKPEKFWSPEKREICTLVFVGSMAWEPNRDAVLWFVKKIFPMVRQGPVRAKLMIAGSFMTKEIAGLDNRKDIIVKGFVRDISEVLLEADVFIAPVRLGSGVNVKVLDAMSFGVPVITTPKGAEGIEGADGEHFMVARNEEEFASAVAYLFRNPEVRKSLGVKAREYISEYHGIDKTIGAFEEALVEVVKGYESLRERPG